VAVVFSSVLAKEEELQVEVELVFFLLELGFLVEEELVSEEELGF